METPEQQGLELAKEAVEETVKQLFAPVQGVMRRLLGPAVTEVGLSFGDSARVWRFERAVKLFEEVERIADAAHIDLRPVAPNLIFPILDAASLADDDLQEKWAALLTNAATTNFATEVLPSFSDVLKQLTPAEVRFLDKVDLEVGQDEAKRREEIRRQKPGWQHGKESEVLCSVRKESLASVSPVMIGNLRRLGLLTTYRERDFETKRRNAKNKCI